MSPSQSCTSPGPKTGLCKCFSAWFTICLHKTRSSTSFMSKKARTYSPKCPAAACQNRRWGRYRGFYRRAVGQKRDLFPTGLNRFRHRRFMSSCVCTGFGLIKNLPNLSPGCLSCLDERYVSLRIRPMSATFASVELSLNLRQQPTEATGSLTFCMRISKVMDEKETGDRVHQIRRSLVIAV